MSILWTGIIPPDFSFTVVSDSSKEPWRHLDSPGLIVLPCCTTGKCDMSLGAVDVFPNLADYVIRSPLGTIVLIEIVAIQGCEQGSLCLSVFQSILFAYEEMTKPLVGLFLVFGSFRVRVLRCSFLAGPVFLSRLDIVKKVPPFTQDDLRSRDLRDFGNG